MTESNVLHKVITFYNMQKLSLPTDLFSFEFHIRKTEDATKFIHFLDNLNERNKHRFNKKFMNERVFISSIFLDIDLIEMFDPYVEIMKKIDNFYDPLTNEFSRKSNTLFDWIVLSNASKLNCKSYKI